MVYLYLEFTIRGQDIFMIYFTREKLSVEVSILILVIVVLKNPCQSLGLFSVSRLGSSIWGSSIDWWNYFIYLSCWTILALYEYCLKEGIADKNLIAKWKKSGYENLCCLRCIQTRDTNFCTNCICRVPKSKLEEVCIVRVNLLWKHIFT